MPKAILEKLPASARKIYEDAWADAKEKGWDEGRCAAYAIGAVKQAGFRKNETTGRWTKMAEPMFAVFGEPVNDGEWLEIACTGTVVDMNGRPVSISESDLERWVQAFEEDERGQEIPITFDHPKSGGKAAGWMRGLMKGPKREIRGAQRTTLLMKPEWTPDGKQSVDHKDYRYFSVEILPENLLRAVSLVNFPAVKGMRPATEPAVLGEMYYLKEFYMAEKLGKCAECGAPLPEGAKACPNCGAEIEQTEPEKEKQNMAEKETKGAVSLEEFNALQAKFESITDERKKLEDQIKALQEAGQQDEEKSKKLAEMVEAQSGRIQELVEINNMLRLHEKAVDFMALSETTKIAPAYEEPLIKLLLLAEDYEQEDEILEFLGALVKKDALVEFGERGTGSVPEPTGPDADRSKLAEKAFALAKEENITYPEALRRLSLKEGK